MKEGLAENKVLILYLLNKLQDGIKSDNLYKIVSSANNMNYFYSLLSPFKSISIFFG